MRCADEIMPIHGDNRGGYHLAVLKKICGKIPVLIRFIAGMEKDYPAVKIQMSGKFIGILDCRNFKNFRDPGPPAQANSWIFIKRRTRRARRTVTVTIRITPNESETALSLLQQAYTDSPTNDPDN